MRGRDGYDFYGNRLRVELAKGGTRDRGGPIPMPPGGFRNKGTGWRVIVKGLPMSASWQDLKVREQWEEQDDDWLGGCAGLAEGEDSCGRLLRLLLRSPSAGPGVPGLASQLGTAQLGALLGQAAS